MSVERATVRSMMDRLASILDVTPDRLACLLKINPLYDDMRDVVDKLESCEEVWISINQLSSSNNLAKMIELPVRSLGGLTLIEAVAVGKSDEAKRYLQTISGGQNN